MMQLRIWIGVNSMITSGNLNLLKVIGKLLDNVTDQNFIRKTNKIRKLDLSGLIQS